MYAVLSVINKSLQYLVIIFIIFLLLNMYRNVDKVVLSSYQIGLTAVVLAGLNFITIHYEIRNAFYYMVPIIPSELLNLLL